MNIESQSTGSHGKIRGGTIGHAADEKVQRHQIFIRFGIDLRPLPFYPPELRQTVIRIVFAGQLSNAFKSKQLPHPALLLGGAVVQPAQRIIQDLPVGIDRNTGDPLRTDGKSSDLLRIHAALTDTA